MVTITNQTTANSLFFHLGDYLQEKGVITREKFNYLFDPFFMPTQQIYQFTVLLKR
ncbi:MAG: hypothetical protein KatS3mg027_2636 [Bacteroidia bacterium]|nr:MAG: hypothetical protein KatS3mg027_2636 [Bacteroidia bacterium]